MEVFQDMKQTRVNVIEIRNNSIVTTLLQEIFLLVVSLLIIASYIISSPVIIMSRGLWRMIFEWIIKFKKSWDMYFSSYVVLSFVQLVTTAEEIAANF